MIKKLIPNKWFYFSLIFLFMLIFNFLTPYIMDDYQFFFHFIGEGKNQNIWDVLVSLKDMYFTWGGRVFAHFFTFLFLLLPKWVFNIINSIVYVCNVYLIYLIAKGEKEKHPAYLLLIHMLLFIFFPVVGQVFFWLDGSCNYSFTLCIQLLFLYKILNIKDVKRLDYFLYFILSFCAGMCNENSSLSLIVFILLFTFFNREELKLKITSFIGLIIGYCVLFFAPGNYVRMETIGGTTSFFHNFFDKLGYLLLTFWPILLGVLLLVIVTLLKYKKEGRICVVFYLSSLVAFFSIIVVPQLSIRCFTLSIIYVFLILMYLIFHIEKKKIILTLFGMIGVYFLIVFSMTFPSYMEYHSKMVKREEMIQKAKKDGEEKVSLEIYEPSNNCRLPIGCELNDISEDSEEYPNNYMSQYYGIKIYGYSASK